MDQKTAARFGAYVRKQRLKAGVSSRGLAETAGVNHAQIVRLEQGGVASPRPDVLARISEALGLEAADLMKRAGYPVEQQIPSLPVYMRAKYDDLPDEAADEVAVFIEELRQRYRADGPRNGEDER